MTSDNTIRLDREREAARAELARLEGAVGDSIRARNAAYHRVCVLNVEIERSERADSAAAKETP